MLEVQEQEQTDQTEQTAIIRSSKKIVVMKRGPLFFFEEPEDMEPMSSLPPDVYVLKCHPLRGFYLQRLEQFEVPKKIYSNLNDYTHRITRSYMSRPLSTGVLLTGEKGSGKTLTAKLVCHNLLKDNIPTIVINEPFCGEAFNQLVQNIPGRAVLLFDEFEKVYDKEHQEQLLTLLDGTYPTHKLFLFTSNDKWGVGDFMHNRPGRVYYCIEFSGLDETFIRQYCEDVLENKEGTDGVVAVAKMHYKFNFDMLQAIVEEMNRFGDSAIQASKLLNIRSLGNSEQVRRAVYKVDCLVDGKKPFSFTHRISHAPLNEDYYATLNVQITKEPDDGDYDEWAEKNCFDFQLSIGILTNFSMASGEYYYKHITDCGKRIDVRLTEEKPKQMDFEAQLAMGYSRHEDVPMF